MDRSLQSALEKRSRIGTWQSRVYRIERGYLSTWPDVTAVTAKKEPTHTECLFQDAQVAIVTDQGEYMPWRLSRAKLQQQSFVRYPKGNALAAFSRDVHLDTSPCPDRCIFHKKRLETAPCEQRTRLRPSPKLRTRRNY